MAVFKVKGLLRRRTRHGDIRSGDAASTGGLVILRTGDVALMFLGLVAVGHVVPVKWPRRGDEGRATIAVEVGICIGKGMDMGIGGSIRIRMRTGVCVGVSVSRLGTRMRLGHRHW